MPPPVSESSKQELYLVSYPSQPSFTLNIFEKIFFSNLQQELNEISNDIDLLIDKALPRHRIEILNKLLIITNLMSFQLTLGEKWQKVVAASPQKEETSQVINIAFKAISKNLDGVIEALTESFEANPTLTQKVLYARRDIFGLLISRVAKSALDNGELKQSLTLTYSSPQLPPPSENIKDELGEQASPSTSRSTQGMKRN